jgi:hypothetical protein
VHREGRQPHGKSANQALVLPARLAVDDRADVCRGSAHVERKRIRESGERRELRSADDARGRSRQQRKRSVARSLVQGREAAR